MSQGRPEHERDRQEAERDKTPPKTPASRHAISFRRTRRLGSFVRPPPNGAANDASSILNASAEQFRRRDEALLILKAPPVKSGRARLANRSQRLRPSRPRSPERDLRKIAHPRARRSRRPVRAVATGSELGRAAAHRFGGCPPDRCARLRRARRRPNRAGVLRTSAGRFQDTSCGHGGVPARTCGAVACKASREKTSRSSEAARIAAISWVARRHAALSASRVQINSLMRARSPTLDCGCNISVTAGGKNWT